MSAAVGPEAPLDCSLCDRLVAYRSENQAAEPTWFNAPVPSFGPDNAAFLVVGLAPGRGGANRTGRPFTGDGAGDVLYPALLRHRFASGSYDGRPDDGLELTNCMITNAVRCVPPENKPTGAETRACRPFLTARLSALPRLKVILALGRIAHDNTVAALGMKRSAVAFGHENTAEVMVDGRPVTLLNSYHCSRYNMNTGRLTEEMFDAVMKHARRLVTA